MAAAMGLPELSKLPAIITTLPPQESGYQSDDNK
jgi:hypothetical protein